MKLLEVSKMLALRQGFARASLKTEAHIPETIMVLRKILVVNQVLV